MKVKIDFNGLQKKYSANYCLLFKERLTPIYLLLYEIDNINAFQIYIHKNKTNLHNYYIFDNYQIPFQFDLSTAYGIINFERTIAKYNVSNNIIFSNIVEKDIKHKQIILLLVRKRWKELNIIDLPKVIILYITKFLTNNIIINYIDKI